MSETVLKMSLSLGFDRSAVVRLTLSGMFLLPPPARRINGAMTTCLSVRITCNNERVVAYGNGVIPKPIIR
jgi:hypothetical protein